MASDRGMTNIVIRPRSILVGCCTDRRDYYHQLRVSPEKAACNAVGPRIPADLALAIAPDQVPEWRPARRREDRGDGLGFQESRKRQRTKGERFLQPCFNSCFQGDHLGVEVATSAHEGVLQEASLLRPENRLLTRGACPTGQVYEGLVIDDYFVLSAEPASLLRPLQLNSEGCSTQALAKLQAALKVYEKHRIAGSPEKDVVNALQFTVAGASVDSSSRAVRSGLITVSVPAQKRCALMMVSLAAARLPCTSRAFLERLVGGWAHCTTYRRPTACCLGKVYQLMHSQEFQDGPGDLVHCLPRAVADELVLCSLLAPLMATNVLAQIEPRLFASDASIKKGALVSTPVSPQEALLLWRTSDRKGGYSRLDAPALAILKGLGDSWIDEGPLQGLPQNPAKTPPMYFDFVEVCAGAGRISHFCAEMGLAVCPPLDLDHSLQYDLASVDVILWLVQMLRAGRLRSVFVSPPCTTFSPAAFPACRTYADPWGDHSVPKVRQGNVLAIRALALVFAARTYGRAGCVEQPRRSKMAWLKVWQALLRLPGVKEVFLAACQFGSIHKKEFRLAGVNLELERLARPCRGGHPHVVIQGKYTKASAVYPDELAREIAIVFGDFIRRDRLTNLRGSDSGAGLESPLINDLLSTRPWTLEFA